jgi:hypothetical protein
MEVLKSLLSIEFNTADYYTIENPESYTPAGTNWH